MRLTVIFFLILPWRTALASKQEGIQKELKRVTGLYVVENLYTQVSRLYFKSCLDCDATLLHEMPIIIGRDSSPTNIGSFKIVKWSHRHVDHLGRYKRWQPKKPGLARWEWNLGDFGYGALMLNTTSGQWSHGTIGMGEDGRRFVSEPSAKQRRGSKGCVRYSNPDIALLSFLLSPGNRLFRVYAQEVGTPYPKLRPKSLNYIVTNRSVYFLFDGLYVNYLGNTLTEKDLVLDSGEVQFGAPLEKRPKFNNPYRTKSSEILNISIGYVTKIEQNK
jgi:hypothetical protein